MSVLRCFVGSQPSAFDRGFSADPPASTPRLSPAPLLTIISAIAVFASFGAIVVQAGDDSGVRDFIRQSSGYSVSGIFRRAERPHYVAYAPRVIYQESRLPYFPNETVGSRRSPAPIIHRTAAAKTGPHRKETRVAGAGIIQPTAYCVRLCDGYEFPLGAATDRATQEETCQQACPASPSALYVAPAGSDGVTKGRDRSGNLYTSLGTAFSYRTSVSPTCGCSNVSGQGVARPPVQHDVTLKRGDIVMTERGLTVFSWANGKVGRFTSIHEAASLTESYRRKLKILESGTIARAPTVSRQAKADIPALEFQAQSDASDVIRPKTDTGQPTAFVRIIARTPPLLR